MTGSGPRLPRREVVARLVTARGDALMVAGLGSPAWDLAAAGDCAANFYLWGGMGGAAMVGLGLALAQPRRRVVVLTGDGELLMGLGALATIGVQQPRNLALLALDNERYGETGMQHSHTHFGVDLAAVATAATFRHCETITATGQLEALVDAVYRRDGPVLAVVKVAAAPAPPALPPRDGAWLKQRFRHALLGAKPAR